MNALVTVIRLYIGGWMLFNGLNYFFLFVPQPMGDKSYYLHVAFMQSGLFAIAKITEVVLGLSLLVNRFVPVSLVMVFPITVIVAWMALFIEDPRPAGTFLFLGHAFLLFAYMPHLMPMLTWRSRPLANTGEVVAGLKTICRRSGNREPWFDVTKDEKN